MTGALETFKMGICAAWTLLGKKVLHHQYHLGLLLWMLEPFRVLSPKQDPSPLPYLQQKETFI
jgi:hypothetical protein